MSAIHFRLFGRPTVTRDGQVQLPTKLQKRSIALFACLAVEQIINGQQAIPRHTLQAFIMSNINRDTLDLDGSNKRRNRFRSNVIPALKKLIGKDAFIESGTQRNKSASLNLNLVETDLAQFHYAVTEYKKVQNTSQTEQKTDYLQQAVEAYQGVFLEGLKLHFTFDKWRQDQASSFHKQYQKLIEELLPLLCKTDQMEQALERARQWEAVDADSVQAIVWTHLLLERIGSQAAHSYLDQRNVTRTMQQGSVWRTARNKILQKMDSPRYRLRGFVSHSIDPTYRAALHTATRQAEQVLISQKYTSVLAIADGFEHEASATNVDSERRLCRVYLDPLRLAAYRAMGDTAGIQQTLHSMEAHHALDAERIEGVTHATVANWYHHRAMIYCWVLGENDRARQDLLDATSKAALMSIEAGTDRSAMAEVEKLRMGLLIDIGMTFWNQGLLKKAESYLADSYAGSDALGETPALVYAAGNMAVVKLYQGAQDEAERYSQEHVELAERFGLTSEVRRARANRSVIGYHRYLQRRMTGSALRAEFLTRAHDDLQADMTTTDGSEPQVNAGVLTAQLYVSRLMLHTDPDQARIMAEYCVQQVERHGFSALDVTALRTLAILSERDQAYYTLQSVLALTHQNLSNHAFDEAAVLLGLAATCPDPAQAENYFQHGRKQLIDLGSGRWVDYMTSPADWVMLPTL